MPRGSARARKPAKRRGRRIRWSTLLPSKRARQRWWRALRRAPAFLQVIVALVSAALLWLAANGTYQVVRKPSELWFPVSGAFYKSPAETWRAYGPLFRRHATAVVTADLLAALAQVEGSGNPVVRTYWRWAATLHPFAVYRPASSAVGMYQITDGTFAEARRYCVRGNAVVEDGPWYDFESCWFNALYTRVVPSHAIELTSAYLDRQVALALRRHKVPGATLAAKQELAALIHLCGAGAGAAHARRGLRIVPGQRCGAHDLRAYLGKVAAQRAAFAKLAAAERAIR